MTLYSHNGAYPAPLPFRIVMPDGFARTDPESFTAEEIAAAGYVEAPAEPSFDPETQHAPKWGGEGWVILPIAPSELAERTEQRRAGRLAELAALRYAKEVAGFTFNGIPIQTDRETQAMLHAARTWALEDPDFTVNYKARDGLFIPADAATIIAIADLAKSHVQACFNHEAALTQQVKAAADPLAVDITAGWP